MPTPSFKDQSILDSTKKILGLSEDDISFDDQIITHINTVFSDLTQMGIGPSAGFIIEDKTQKWSDFIKDESLPDNTVVLSRVRTYLPAKVRMMFDPPSGSVHMDALKAVITESEYRLYVAAGGH